MKKITAIVLALVVVLLAFAACGGEKTPDVTPYEGTLTDLASKIYAIQSVEFMLDETRDIDLTDADTVKSFTGLDDASNIKEAVISQSFMGQPYQLVIARVNDAAKIEETKKAMFDGVDTRRWICVEANELRVASYSDVIVLVMSSTENGAGIADGMVEAFKTTVGELSGETLTLNK